MSEIRSENCLEKVLPLAPPCASTLRLDRTLVSQRPRLKDYDGRIVTVSVHLEKPDDAPSKDDALVEQRLDTIVDRVERRGTDLIIHGIIDATPVSTTPAAATAGTDAQEPGHRRGNCSRRPVQPAQQRPCRRPCGRRGGHDPSGILRPRHWPRHLGLNAPALRASLRAIAQIGAISRARG